MLTASLINQLYITDTQPISGLPIQQTSIYRFSFSRVNRTHATNIRVRNSHHSLNSTGCGHFANSEINCLMSSGHSFRVKQETKQLKSLPNVITAYWSTRSEETFIFCLISNCKRSIVFCDIPSACLPACLTTNVIINININIRHKSTHCHIPAVDIQTVLDLGHLQHRHSCRCSAPDSIRQGESKDGTQVVVCPVTPGNYRCSPVNTTQQFPSTFLPVHQTYYHSRSHSLVSSYRVALQLSNQSTQPYL
jgi:hypothetical protein